MDRKGLDWGIVIISLGALVAVGAARGGESPLVLLGLFWLVQGIVAAAVLARRPLIREIGEVLLGDPRV